MLGWLLQESHRAPAAAIPRLVREAAATFGASHAVVYLVDYGQTVLTPLTDGGEEVKEPLSVDHTLAGRAYQTEELLAGTDDPGNVWVPVLDGTERLGVLYLRLPEGPERLHDVCWHLASMTAQLVVSKIQYGDLITRTRAAGEMTLAADLQWHLLPPLTFITSRVAVSGAIEPAYEVGGDVFDYALNGDHLHVALFDAMGHGLDAGITSTLAIGAYRYHRRAGEDVTALYSSVSAALEGRFGSERFVTALLADLDCSTGRLSIVNAGHPRPLLLRGAKLVGEVECPPNLPLGIGVEARRCDFQLEPGDRLLLFTDGLIEARGADRVPFGVERLGDFLVRETLSGHAMAEVVRRVSRAVLDHHNGLMEDDSTLVLVEWTGS